MPSAQEFHQGREGVLAAVGHALHAAFVSGAMARWHHYIGHRAAQRCLTRQAKHPLGGRVEFDDMAVGITGDDGRQGVVHDGRLELLGHLQRLLAFTQLARLQLGVGQVADEAEDQLGAGARWRAWRDVRHQPLVGVAAAVAGVFGPAFPVHLLAREEFLGHRQIALEDGLAAHLCDGRADNLVGGQAEEIDGCLIGPLVAVLTVEHGHAQGHALE